MQQTGADTSFVPVQENGKALDLEATTTCASEKEASDTVRKARNRLMNPHVWHRLTGTWAASFKLVAAGTPDPERQARVNDYIRIDIPGPGTVAGEGYDWVRIEDIHHHPEKSADESFGITVRAAANPRRPQEGTAHFFSEGATSTFMVKRKGLTVTASYHGRNERPNSDAPSVADKLRNTVVASAAMAGISELQWRSFLEGLLK